MSHIKNSDIETMSSEQLLRTLDDLKDELLQLRAQQALGGSSSNSGSYKQTRRSIARILTKINQENKGGVFLIDLGKYPSNTPSSLLVRSGV